MQHPSALRILLVMDGPNRDETLLDQGRATMLGMFQHLGAVDPAATATWLQCARLLRLDAQAHYLRAGEVTPVVALLLQGCMRYYYVEPHREVNSHFVREGMWVGDYGSFLTQQPTSMYIQALEPSVLLLLPYAQVQWAYDNIPGMDRVGRKVAELEFVTLREQYALHLRNLPEERYRVLMAAHPWVAQRVPQRHIASWLGVTPESLSRLKRRLTSR